jgi:anaerobic ribonucleoside-triphosphate reductase activating protein
MEYTISIKDIEPESISDGDGIRAVIFCVGCDFRCKNCHNPKTWDINNGYVVPIQEIYEKLDLERNVLLDGVTFSGGEPMLQATAFRELARMIKQNPDKNIWCYTGYRYEDLIKNQDEKYELLKEIDILVDGLYIEELKDWTVSFRGSSNQRIIDVQESLKQNAIIIIMDEYFKKISKTNLDLEKYRKRLEIN